MMITRRQLIKTTIAGTVISILPRSLLWAEEARPIQLKAVSKIIEINKKPAKIFTLESNIPYPFTLAAPGRFYVRLTNQLADHTLIHWHGLTPPSNQDGVPELSQAALKPGQSFLYDFPLDEPGTHWMHSHFGMQEQKLLAAPLIIQPLQSKPAYREILLFLQDFMFAETEEIYQKLRGKNEGSHTHHQGMNMGGSMAHLHDVEPDAFLANQRTLDDPELVMIENGETIRLRVINAAATTNGASIGTVETTTNKVMVKTLDHDASTVEYDQFAVRMPKSWDRGTITAVFVWSHAATATNFGVEWLIRALAIGNGDACDAAFGSWAGIPDTGGTTDALYISDETGAVTVAGSPQSEDWVVFEIAREVTNILDTLAVDARLHGVTLYITTDAENDA